MKGSPMNKDLDWAVRQIEDLRQEVKNTRADLGLVLKAIEEELKDQGIVTTERLQKRIMELVGAGWRP